MPGRHQPQARGQSRELWQATVWHFHSGQLQVKLDHYPDGLASSQRTLTAHNGDQGAALTADEVATELEYLAWWIRHRYSSGE